MSQHFVSMEGKTIESGGLIKGENKLGDFFYGSLKVGFIKVGLRSMQPQ